MNHAARISPRLSLALGVAALLLATGAGAADVYVLELSELAKLYRSDIEAYALLILNISREISRRLRCADELIVSMGISADSLWSDAADSAARSSKAAASEPS